MCWPDAASIAALFGSTIPYMIVVEPFNEMG
jgi:hypothetical protein